MSDTSQPTGEIVRAAPDLVSIVVPACNEAGNVGPLAEAVHDALGEMNYELIFVDDGSRDATFANIEALAEQDDRVVGLSLSRNFGHQYALAAGLRRARGQVIVMMDGDLQHPPSLIPVLIAKWRQGYNIVQTVRQDDGQLPLVKRVTSRAFYSVFSTLCGIRIDAGMADFRLIDRAVLEELNAMQEGQLFLRGLFAWMGYRQAVVPFKVGQRLSGTTKYSMRKMIKFAKSGIFSFSPMPLRIGITVGLVISILSFAELAYVLVMYAIGRTQPGWASQVGITALLFGVLFLLVGLQGEYISRIYERVQRRPPFIVERTTDKKQSQQSDGEQEKK